MTTERQFRWPRLVLLTATWLIVLYLIAPNLVAIPVSLTSKAFFSVPAFGDYSLRHYSVLLNDPRWIAAFWTSIKVAVLSTLLATILGTAAAIGLAQLKSHSANAVRFLVLMPMIVPTVVSGLAFYRVWVRLDWLDTLHGLVIAHMILIVPFIFIMVSSSVSLLDPRLLQASRSLGAGQWRTIAWVVLPNVKSGILGGSLIAFLISWDEVIATTFLTSFRMETLPKRILFVVRDDLDPSVASASVVLMVMTLGLLLLSNASRRTT